MAAESRKRTSKDKEVSRFYSRGLKTNFTSGKDLYLNKIALPGFSQDHQDSKDSKYTKAAKLGLCFHCMREDTNPLHRPKHRIFAYCPECMAEMGIGMDALEQRSKTEVEKWFSDEFPK